MTAHTQLCPELKPNNSWRAWEVWPVLLPARQSCFFRHSDGQTHVLLLILRKILLLDKSRGVEGWGPAREIPLNRALLVDKPESAAYFLCVNDIIKCCSFTSCQGEERKKSSNLYRFIIRLNKQNDESDPPTALLPFCATWCAWVWGMMIRSCLISSSMLLYVFFFPMYWFAAELERWSFWLQWKENWNRNYSN